VHDSVGLPSPLLENAEAEISWVFRAADIEMYWVNCSILELVQSCRRVPGVNEFVLHIVPNGKTRNDLVFGEAFLGEDGRGKYIDVFFDRIYASARAGDLDASRLLGAVSAHELGHLLLGSRSHSFFGIMEPVWPHENLRKISMGTFLFTGDQSRQMRKRIRDDEVSLSAIRVLNREPFGDAY